MMFGNELKGVSFQNEPSWQHNAVSREIGPGCVGPTLRETGVKYVARTFATTFNI